jgi:hypothetical protein
MSDSNWGARDTVFFVVAAIAVLSIVGYGIWGVSALHTKEAIKAGQRAGQYTKDTEQQIFEACTVAELSIMRDCVTKKIQASEENQRAAKDLVAQDVTARWTFGVFWLGLGSSALSILGLYFLAANLAEIKHQRGISQQALDTMATQSQQNAALLAETKASNKIASEQHRPWIKLEFTSLRVAIRKIDQNQVQFEFPVRVMNVGELPAQNLCCATSISIVPHRSFINTHDAVKEAHKNAQFLRDNHLGVTAYPKEPAPVIVSATFECRRRDCFQRLA